MNGKKCTKEVIDVKNAKVSSYSCASGFTYDASDGKCHKTENLGCPDGYTDDGNGCSKKVTVELICGNPYHVCGNNCCEDDGTITQRVQPHCSYGYSLSNSGDKCETWVYENRICVGNNSTQIPGSFLCDVVDNATPNYSCSSYGSDYLLEETKCTKTTTETINATKK